MKLPVIKIDADDAKYETRTLGQRQVKQQFGYVQLGDKYPVKIKFNLPDGRENAYGEGEYVIDLDSYEVGKYGNLQLNPFSLSLSRLVTPADVKKAS